MVEFENSNGIQTATIRGVITERELHALEGVEALTVAPESAGFEMHTPLHSSRLRILQVSNCHQPLLHLVDKHALLKLETLTLADSSGVLVSISQLGDLQTLRRLHIRRLDLSSEAAAWLCQQRNIASMSVTDSNVTDDLILELRCKGSLKRLDVFGNPLTFADDRLGNDPFRFVRSLDVSETNVSRCSIQILRDAFPRLERFLAEQTELNDSDVEQIAAWDGLKVLATNTPGLDFDTHNDEFWDL